MIHDLRYSADTSSSTNFLDHLATAGSEFFDDLSQRVNIDEYVEKITSRATRIEAWYGDELVGIVALYANDAVSRIAFVTHVSVSVDWQGSGLARTLLREAMAIAAERGMTRVDLEVSRTNERARRLYRSLGLADVYDDGRTNTMSGSIDPEREQRKR